MAKTAKKIILIVEDDEVLLRALYLLFHKSGNTIASATYGDEALKMTLRIKPDIVLLDLLLPVMNGFDYLKDIRSNPDFKNLPIIVLSNLGDQENIAKAKGLGATDYYIKADTDLSTLYDKVDKILKT